MASTSLRDGLIASQFHSGVEQQLAHLGQEVGRDRAMDQQLLRGVADSGTVRLRVHDDVGCHFEVGRGVDIDVAVAGSIDDIRNGGVGFDRGDEVGTAAWDQEVDPLLRLHQGLGASTGGVLDRSGRHPPASPDSAMAAVMTLPMARFERKGIGGAPQKGGIA